MRVFHGEGIAPGVAIGRVHVFEDIIHRNVPKTIILPSAREREQLRFLKAYEATLAEINELIKKVHREIGLDESAIFQAHVLILNDKRFAGEMLRLVSDELLSAESAVRQVVESWEKTFSASSSAALQSKVFDIIDIGKRILAKLSREGTPGEAVEQPAPIPQGGAVILAARMLLPSHTAFIDKKQIAGIITELGNKASHSAVIAKSLGIPTVFGVKGVVSSFQSGDEVIIDGSSGTVLVNPDAAVRREYESIRRKFVVYRHHLESLTDLPCVTPDGRSVALYANIGAVADMEMALRYRARGVGLYRTEMPFLIRNEFPDEDTQYAIYRRVVEKMKGKPVGIRTLDLGGDKVLNFLSMPKEENPNLGWRAIRVFLDNPHFFKIQLKAILRAATAGNVRIILPMISDLTEVRISKRILAEARRELQKKNIPFNSNVKLGIMIEVPSAVMLAEYLIEEVDFFSVGTNDLIQYTLAVDRNSEKAARFFEPLNPAIILMLRKLIDITNRAGKDITICGEIASEPLYLPILLGLGYTRLSVNSLAINMVKSILRATSFHDAQELVREVMKKRTGVEVREYMKAYFERHKGRMRSQAPILYPSGRQ